jgi:hypothetical protein
MRVETEAAVGRWSAIPANVAIENAPYPARVRRAVIEELKGDGIGWMDWWITAIADSNGYRLWRLD